MFDPTIYSFQPLVGSSSNDTSTSSSMKNILTDHSKGNGAMTQSGSLDLAAISLTSSLPTLENLPDDSQNELLSKPLEVEKLENKLSLVTTEKSVQQDENVHKTCNEEAPQEVFQDGDNQSSEGMSSRKTSTVSATEFTSPEYTPENTLIPSQLEQLPNQVEPQPMNNAPESRKTSVLTEVIVVHSGEADQILNRLPSDSQQNTNKEVSVHAQEALQKPVSNVPSPKTTPVRKLSRFLVSPVVLPSTDPNSTLIQVQESIPESQAIGNEQLPKRVSQTENALNEVLVVQQTNEEMQPSSITWIDTGQSGQVQYQNQQQFYPSSEGANQLTPIYIPPAQIMNTEFSMNEQPQDICDTNAATQFYQQQQLQQQQQQRSPQILQSTNQGPQSLTGIVPSSDTQCANRMPETLEQLKIELENITHAHVSSTKVSKEQIGSSGGGLVPVDQAQMSVSSPGIMENQPVFISPHVPVQQIQQQYQPQQQIQQPMQQLPVLQQQQMQYQQQQPIYQQQQPMHQQQPMDSHQQQMFQQQQYYPQTSNDYNQQPTEHYQQLQQPNMGQQFQNSFSNNIEASNAYFGAASYSEELTYVSAQQDFTPPVVPYVKSSETMNELNHKPLNNYVGQEIVNDNSNSCTLAASSLNTSLYNSRRTSADLNNPDATIVSSGGGGDQSGNKGTPAGGIMSNTMNSVDEKMSQNNSVDKADR
jgi:hypothetical protein